MKKYYRNYRRRGNTVFCAVVGGLLIVLGALIMIFDRASYPYAIVGFVFGALLVTVPLFFIHASYGVDGNKLKIRILVPKKVPVDGIGAVVIAAYDASRRWKGIQKETFVGSSGETYNVPSVTFLRGCDGEELDLCDTRSSTRITYKNEYIFDAALDFGFLRAFADAGYEGKVYVSESIYAQYGGAIDDIFGKDGRVEVYDRIPKNVKRMLEEQNKRR